MSGMDSDEDNDFHEGEIVDFIDPAPNGGDIAGDIGDMDLEHYDEEEDDADDEDEEEQMCPGSAVATPASDDADTCFKTHKGSVFSCALDPIEGALAISGGEDDKAYIWNTTNGEVFMECTGHKDSVTCVGFNRDGTLAATGDMSGIIKVWTVENKEEIWSFDGSDLEWLHWHPIANVLLGGTSVGDVWMWKMPSGDCKTMQGHGCQSTCGNVMPDGKRCVVGYEDGAIKVWDLKEQTVLHHIKRGGHGHTGSITCIDCHKDNSMVLTGSIDGTAKLLNANTGKVVTTFPAGPVDESIGETNSVECVGFSPSQTLAAVGSLNGFLSIWDVPTTKLRHQCKTEAGIVRMKWDKSSPMIFTAGLEGEITLWDSRSGQIVSTYEGHVAEILDFDLSSDGNTMVSASGDGTCRIFSVSQPDR